MLNVAGALGALFVLAALAGMAPDALRVLGLATLIVLVLGALWDGLSLLMRHRPAGRRGRSKRGRGRPGRSTRPAPRAPARPASLIVDGSNVMHWNGEPSQMVLTRVVAKLVQSGECPHVYFDANVGYKLQGQYMGNRAMAKMLGLPENRVTVVDAGVPADPVLLEHAVNAKLRVVTNDRFMEWRPQFPQIGNRGFLVKGHWQQGTPMVQL
ncbi:hypothetical protein [Loktanella sp. R86503]|uniref:hypothetical protein n=1 Tax=Loktanella sp. R86503 TaxID=3093847 RepID=UPI0036DAC924